MVTKFLNCLCRPVLYAVVGIHYILFESEQLNKLFQGKMISESDAVPCPCLNHGNLLCTVHSHQ